MQKELYVDHWLEAQANAHFGYVDFGVSVSGQRAREKLAGAITGLFNLSLPAGGTGR